MITTEELKSYLENVLNKEYIVGNGSIEDKFIHALSMIERTPRKHFLLATTTNFNSVIFISNRIKYYCIIELENGNYSIKNLEKLISNN